MTSGLLIDCRRIGTELGGEREKEGEKKGGNRGEKEKRRERFAMFEILSACPLK